MDARHILDLVKGGFVLRVALIHKIVVHDMIVVHQREAVDVGFLGDGPRFGGCGFGS